jgi:lysophospholipase L1-like esterase
MRAMRRVDPDLARRAVLIAALFGCGCKSSAPASSRIAARAPAASEWTGVRGDAREEAPTGRPPASGAQPARDAQAPRDWVLHIGDSFTHAFLRQNLGPRFHAAGARYVVDATTATYTTTWAGDPDLDQWLARRPALVLVTLGANEFDIPFPAVHAHAVATIAHKIAAAGAACVWIAPPMWTPDTGILQVIYENCAPCVYFDSDAILGGLARSEREPDRIHPNARGGARWAEAFWGWLMDHRDPAGGPWAITPFERRND